MAACELLTATQTSVLSVQNTTHHRDQKAMAGSFPRAVSVQFRRLNVWLKWVRGVICVRYSVPSFIPSSPLSWDNWELELPSAYEYWLAIFHRISDACWVGANHLDSLFFFLLYSGGVCSELVNITLQEINFTAFWKTKVTACNPKEAFKTILIIPPGFSFYFIFFFSICLF